MRHKTAYSLRYFLLVAGLLCAFAGTGEAHAQSVDNMVNGDTVHLDACALGGGTIYDDGGAAGNYSNNFDGWAVIESSAGIDITLSGNYTLEGCCDRLWVYDDTSPLIDGVVGSGTINVTATSGRMYIRFSSDGSATFAGFELTWSVAGLSGACSNPVTNLDTTAVTANSIGLTWNATDPTGPFTIVCNDIVVGTATTTSYTLTGLNASSYHDIHVVATASAANRCCSDRIKVRTACGGTTMPFSDGFEGLAEGSFPPCWLMSVNFDDEDYLPQVVTTQHSSGSNSLLLSCGNTESAGHFGMVATPPLQGTGSHTVRLQLRASHDGTVVVIGTCDSVGDDYNAYGFTPAQTLYVDANHWQEYTVSWTPNGSGRRLALRMEQAQQSGIARRLYIDDMQVEECGVDSLVAMHVEHDRLTLQWGTYGSPTCNLGIRRAGILTDSVTLPNVTSPLDITGLDASTRYTFTIYPSCGTRPSNSRSTTVRTAAPPTSADGYCSGFSGLTTLPQNWKITGSGGCDFNFYMSDGLCCYNGCSGATAYLASERLLGLPGKQVTVAFDRENTGTSVVIGTMLHADDPSTFVALDSARSDGGYQSITVDVPATSTGRHIAICLRNPGWYINLRILSVSCNSCGVDRLKIEHRRGTTMVLSWAEAYDTVLVQHGPQGFALGTGQVDTILDSRRGTIEGLTPSTEYDLFVYRPCQAPCEDMRIHARTAKHDYPLPYCEDFDTLTGADIDYYSGGDWWIQTENNGTPSFDYQGYDGYAGRTLKLSSWGFNYGYYSQVMLPDIEVDSNTILSLWINDNAPDSYLIIGTLDDRYLPDNWNTTDSIHILDTIPIFAHNHREHITYTLRPSDTLFNSRLVLRYMHNYEYSYYTCLIDEMQFQHSAYEGFAAITDYTDAVVNLSGLIATGSAVVTLIGDGNTFVDTATAANITNIVFNGLDSGTFYRCYVTLPNGCTSYAGYLITRANGGGTSNCFPFHDVLSDELPPMWAATDSTRVTTGDWLQVDSGIVVATHPTWGLGDLSFSLRARSGVSGDTLLFGTIPADSIDIDSTHFVYNAAWFTPLDTFVLDTTWRSYMMRLPAMGTDTIRLCLVAGPHTMDLDDIGFDVCPIVHFTVEGNNIVCTMDEDQSATYYLTLTDTTGEERVILVESNPYRVEGLKLGMRYDLTWECLYMGSDCRPTASVTTDPYVRLPYCEDFNVASGSLKIPSTWTIIKGDANDYVQLDTWGPSLMLQPYNYDGNVHSIYAVMPQFIVDSALSLFTYMYNWQRDGVQIGVIDNNLDTSTFVPLWSDVAYDWINASVDFTGYTDKRIALRINSDTRIFNVHVYDIPLAKISLTGAQHLEISTDVARPYYLHHRDDCWMNVDTMIRIESRNYTLESQYCNYVYLTQGSDSTGYTCEGEKNYFLSYKQALPYCFSGNGNILAFSYAFYGQSGMYDWYDKYSDGVGYPHFFGQNSQWMVLHDMDIDSIKHAGMRFHYDAASEHDTMVVGILVDAYDTNTFTAIDTFTYTRTDGEPQAGFVDFSSYADTGRWITFHYLRRPQNEWFDITALYVENCPAAMGATATLSRWNRVKIDSPRTPFYVEYFPTGTSSQGNGSNPVMRVDSVPLELTLLPETEYEFYFHCDSAVTTCVPPQYVTTLAAPMEVPTCTDFDTVVETTVPHNWTARHAGIGATTTVAHSGTTSMAMPVATTSYLITPDINIDTIGKVALSLWFQVEDLADRLVVGVMSNPADIATFYPIRTLAPNSVGTWEHQLVEFSIAPADAHFIALRARSNRPAGERKIYVDDIYLSDCAAFDFRVQSLTTSSINLTWSQVGNPDVTITVMDGDSVASTLTGATPPIEVSPLVTLHYYTFIMNSECGTPTSDYCTTNYRDSLSVVTPAPGVGCVNPTDLASPQAVFFSGSYSNPYSHAGAINYGSQSPDSRHTVCYDTAQRDPRTGGQLRTIPEGYTSSVRLGNWSTNAYNPEAEGVIYGLTVDTSSFELLLLRYAAVLQDPLHDPADQPRFRMELLDTNYNIIDSACTSADFIADRNLGWNTADDGVLWKDWTAVGVDLSGHAGEQVYFRLTTYDCNEGSHYGYAYFTLECMRKNMNTESCGDVDSNTLSAPEGFHYRWYTDLSPATVSTAQNITVANHDVTYFCDVSKLDNAACNFTISAYGGTRYPMASFDTSMTIDSCHFKVSFSNTSSISKDGTTPVSGTTCETAYWDFGNGTTSHNFHGSATYLLPGTYTVMLVSGIAYDACQDTTYMTLTLELPEGMLPSDTTEASICDNQSYTFNSTPRTEAGTYYYFTPNAGTCDSLHVLQLDVRHTSNRDTVAVECDSATWKGLWFYADTVHVTPPVGLNAQNCDSTETLHLTVHYSDTADIADTIVQNDLPYPAAGTSIVLADLTTVSMQKAAGQWQLHTTTVHGCDSTLNLDLTVWLNRATTVDTSICRNRLPLVFLGSSFSPVPTLTTHVLTIPTTHAADSVITLNITVYENPTATYADTVHENELPHTFRGRTFTAPADTLLVLLSSGIGCDTMADYNLHIWYNQDTTVYRSICRSQLPYLWEGHTFGMSDSIGMAGLNIILHHDTIIPTTHGADSTMHLEVTVKPVYDTTDHLIICPGYPYTYRGVDYGGPTAFDAHLLTTVDCDSIVHVTIVPRDPAYRLYPLYSFGSEPWAVPDTLIVGCTPTTLNLRDTTPGAAARLWTLAMPDTVASDSASLFAYDFPTAADPTAAVASLIVRDAIGCFDTLAWPVLVFRSPVADFRWEPEVPLMSHPEAQFQNLTAIDSGAWDADATYPFTYLWHIGSPNGDSDTSTAVNPHHSWGEATDQVTGNAEVSLEAYWLHTVGAINVGPYDTISAASFALTDIVHTCVDSVTHTVTISNDYLQFPNLVTPNGDGINDTWVIVNLVEFGEYPTNELWIYNQWGALVYHVRDIRTEDQMWDPDKTNSPAGAYYYRFTARGRFGITKRNGLIEVVR